MSLPSFHSSVDVGVLPRLLPPPRRAMNDDCLAFASEIHAVARAEVQMICGNFTFLRSDSAAFCAKSVSEFLNSASEFPKSPDFLGKMVGATGFEPATSWSQTKCSSQAELRSEPGARIIHTTRPVRNAYFHVDHKEPKPRAPADPRWSSVQGTRGFLLSTVHAHLSFNADELLGRLQVRKRKREI